jgi:ABC-type phosphate/phosphonate transport system permease subunit
MPFYRVVPGLLLALLFVAALGVAR